MKSLELVTQPLLMPVRPHALAALVLGNFRFPPFFQRAHSDFQIREFRFNHVTRCVATELYAACENAARAHANRDIQYSRMKAGFCVACYF
jgi:hypothetical protein